MTVNHDKTMTLLCNRLQGDREDPELLNGADGIKIIWNLWTKIDI